MSEILFTQLCHRDVGMARACFGSLAKAWQTPWDLHVVEDGSVTEADWAELQADFPSAVFHRKSEIKPQLEEWLSHHPTSLAFYREHVLAPKLFEAPFLSDSICQYCDSDILFFRQFRRLYPADAEMVFLYEDYKLEGYCHSVFDLAIRYRIPVAADLSAGFYRFSKRYYDLDRIEWFLRRSQKPLDKFLVEQECWASLAVRGPHRLMAPDAILCSKQPLPETNLPAAIHYIGPNKKRFWEYVPRVDVELKRPALEELGTIAGRRLGWDDVAAQVVRGLRRRAGRMLAK